MENNNVLRAGRALCLEQEPQLIHSLRERREENMLCAESELAVSHQRDLRSYALRDEKCLLLILSQIIRQLLCQLIVGMSYGAFHFFLVALDTLLEASKVYRLSLIARLLGQLSREVKK